MRLCELREKDVINLCDGKRLGNVMDLEVDLMSGRVCRIIVPAAEGVCKWICAGGAYVIPVECIRKIGEDLIIVEICAEKYYEKG